MAKIAREYGICCPERPGKDVYLGSIEIKPKGKKGSFRKGSMHSKSLFPRQSRPIYKAATSPWVISG